MESVINFVLLALLVVIAIEITRLKDLFAVVMLTGIYGLVSASFFVLMDAVDVAFTEASVGAGISTLLMLVVISLTQRSEHPVRYRPFGALLVVMLTGGMLIYGTLDMPYMGAGDAPIHIHIAPRYLNDSMQEVGVVNVVTAVLASYRSFDTFGELVVIFTAGIGVSALLMKAGHRDDKKQAGSINDSMHKQHLILRIVSKIMLPFIMLFALYVQFHGDYGPGGGFQAGVIFAAAIILYALLFGLTSAHRVINQTTSQLVAAFGVLLYGSVGLVSLLNGGNFLDYNVLASNPVSGQHLGILFIELGVGITVASVMITIFFNFAGRQVPQKNKDS